MKSFFDSVATEIRLSLKERRFRLLLLLLPILLSLLFASIFLPRRAAQKFSTALCDLDNTASSRALIRRIESLQAVSVDHRIGSVQEGRELFLSGKVRAVVVVPKGFSEKLKRRQTARVEVFEDFVYIVPGRTLLKGFYKVESWYQNQRLYDYFQRQGVMASGGNFLSQPVRVDFRSLFNPSLEYTTFILPGVLFAVLFQMLSVQGVILFFSHRKEIPLKPFGRFLAVKLTAHSLLAFIPFVIVYGLFFALIGLPQGNPLPLIPLFLLFALATLLMGALTGAITGDSLLATSLIILIGATGFTFSGYTWPRMAFPALLKNAVFILPITPFLQEANKILFSTRFPLNFIPMLLVTLGYLVLVYITQSLLGRSRGE